ncbi:MAG: ATP-binding protein [Aquabacterium sp.]
MTGASQLITLLGAESTGKTTLARELSRILASRGLDAVMVPEALRLFCDRTGRTPLPHEQASIAAEQTRLIDAAHAEHHIVLADTSALTIAVYSDYLFDDQSLYAQAERDQAQSSMTLLTSLDLAWTADGIIRDGPHVREPVDALIRSALQRIGQPYAIVAGQGVARIQHALSAIEHLLDTPAREIRAASSPRWRWFCDNCDDGECEQHWLPRAR